MLYDLKRYLRDIESPILEDLGLNRVAIRGVTGNDKWFDYLLGYALPK